jgi:hypothetical protein
LGGGEELAAKGSGERRAEGLAVPERRAEQAADGAVLLAHLHARAGETEKTAKGSGAKTERIKK